MDAADQSFLTDPLTFASRLRGRPVLMINAKWDKYIPREAVTEFWEACGKPPIRWIPSGHATIWVWYSSILKSVTGLFNSSLGGGLDSRRQAGL